MAKKIVAAMIVFGLASGSYAADKAQEGGDAKEIGQATRAPFAQVKTNSGTILSGQLEQNSGTIEDPKDPAVIFSKNKSLAEQGNATAQAYLGLAYSQGLGVAKDMAQALNWYNKAAEQGYVLAQLNLATHYYRGIGVAPDLKLAREWFRKAAAQGNAKAQLNLGIIYNLGKGVDPDYREASEWFLKAAEQGIGDAQVALASTYRILALKDSKYNERAYFWLLVASAQGEDAPDLREKAEKSLTPEQRTAIQAEAQAWKPKK